MRFTTRSSTGIRTRPPNWWMSLIEKVPQLELPFLYPKEWTPELARKWIKLIPSKCPFERQLWWGERLIFYVPPLCPFNPLSTQLYKIRIKAQCYLVSLPTRESSDTEKSEGPLW